MSCDVKKFRRNRRGLPLINLSFTYSFIDLPYILTYLFTDLGDIQ